MPKEKKPKLLNKTTAKKLNLEVIAEDNERGDESVPLGDQAEWYVVTNGSFLLRIHYEMIKDTAWDHLNPEKDPARPYYNPSRSKADALSRVMPDWLQVICPQAGGLLSPVEIKKAEGTSLPGVGKQAFFTHKAVTYFLPSAQVWLVRNFWPAVRFYIGPHLKGVDLFGDVVEKLSPVIAAVKDVGAVGAIMLYKETI